MNSTAHIRTPKHVNVYMPSDNTLNQELIKTSEKLFKQPLNELQIMEITKMSKEHKEWLLQQYKQEVSFIKEPDLSSLY
jgi:orotate phosphoribosyltransferase-like protein